MKSNNKVLEKNFFLKMYIDSSNTIHNNTIKFIKYYDSKYKFIQNKLIQHELDEPMKILKKAHKKWEEERIKLNVELEETFNKLINEYKEIENIIDFI